MCECVNDLMERNNPKLGAGGVLYTPFLHDQPTAMCTSVGIASASYSLVAPRCPACFPLSLSPYGHAS